MHYSEQYYSCTILGTNSTQDIFLLWDGSLMFNDNALQLVLIVDYIVDWARDIYRPSLLRQLISLSTGQEYNLISEVCDSDIYSTMRQPTDWGSAAPNTFGELNSLGGRVLNWIPAPPSAVTESNANCDSTPITASLKHEGMLPIDMPITAIHGTSSSRRYRSRETYLWDFQKTEGTRRSTNDSGKTSGI